MVLSKQLSKFFLEDAGFRWQEVRHHILIVGKPISKAQGVMKKSLQEKQKQKNLQSLPTG